MDENKENKNRENEKKSRKKGRAGLLIALVLVCVFLAAAAAAKLGLFGRDISPAGSAAEEPAAEQTEETPSPAVSEEAYMLAMNSKTTLDQWRIATNDRLENPLKHFAEMPPTMTIIDDDTTNVELVQRYHAICEEMGVKGNYGVITSRLEEVPGLKELLLQYEDEGYGMLFHCYKQTGATYFKPESRDLTLCEANYCRGVRQMREFGFTNYDYWISPYGVNDPEMQNMCKRHGAKCLISTYNNTFISPNGMKGEVAAERYNIPRCSLGHNAERYPHFSIDDLKAQIDACAAAHGWIIITTHANEWGNTTQGDDRLRDIIRYAQERGYDFKTFAEAFEDRLPLFYLNEILGAHAAQQDDLG